MSPRVTLVKAALLCFLVSAFPVANQAAEPQTQNSLKNALLAADDPMSHAFEDEISRSMTHLKLGSNPPPYFMSYLGRDQEHLTIYGAFGALDLVDRSHNRYITADVRTGDYALDSSSHAADGFFFPNEGPLEDNYDAIRHTLWLLTDSGYKTAIESLGKKRAQLEQKNVENRPRALSQTDRVISMQKAAHLSGDLKTCKELVKDVSNVYRQFPRIIDSNVYYFERARTRWFANSEGSLNREGETGCVFGINAIAESKDGMRVGDVQLFTVPSPDQLPSAADLKKHACEFASRLIEIADAPTIEDYHGPILFEKQAAAELFGQTLAPKLVNNGNEERSTQLFKDYGNWIGRRIMPKSVTVTDDPTATEYNGVPLKGSYLVDDEGVQAKKVTLVEKGILRGLCSGRECSRYSKASNGHFRDGHVLPSTLFITSNQVESLDGLRRRLIDIGRDEELDYVIIVRRIQPIFTGRLDTLDTEFASHFAEELSLSAPTELIKVDVKDGHEELIRGARFAHVSSRIWRDIVGVGDDPQVHAVHYPIGGNSTLSNLITPSVLVSEIDLERATHETSTPLRTQNPYFE